MKIDLEELLSKLPLPKTKHADYDVDFWVEVIGGLDDMITLDEYYEKLALATKAQWDEDPISPMYYNKVPRVLADIFQEYHEEARQTVIEYIDHEAGRLSWYERLSCLLGFGSKEELLEEQKESAELAKEMHLEELSRSRYESAKMLAFDVVSVLRDIGRLRSFWYVVNEETEQNVNEYLEKRPKDIKGCYLRYLDMVASYHS